MRAVRRGEMLRAVNGLRVRPVVLAALLCAAAFPPVALGAASLVFPASELHALGFRPVGASAATARRTLGLGLPRGTAVQASAGRARGESLSFDAFAIPSPGAAKRLFTRWKREHRAESVPVGAGGAVWSRARAAEVLWREGSRLGLVVLKGSRSTRESAISYAFSADQSLGVMLPTTAWQKVLDQVRSNGTMSEQTALQAVALAYGPVPGVKPPQGTRTAIASGTLAAQWALHYSGRLSGRRRAVIDRLLGVEPVRSAAAAQAPDWGDPSFRELKALDDLANHWATIEGAHLGIAPGLKIVAGTSSDNIDAYADSLPLNQDRQYGSGQPVYCRIRLDPAGQKAEPQFVGLVVAHEVFHCFEFQILGTRAWTPLPAWIGEGAADWVALTVDPVPWSVGGGNLKWYLGTSNKNLFARSYDAVGFFGHLEDSLGGAWYRLRPMILAADSADAFAASGANSSPFLDSWGSSVFNQPAFGLDWNMISPLAPPTSNPFAPELVDLKAVGAMFVSAGPYSTWQYQFDDPDEVVHVRIAGNAQLHDSAGGNDYTALSDAWFCTSDSCKCPPGTNSTLPQTQPLAGFADLGLAGNATGAGGYVDTYPLSAFCEPPTPTTCTIGSMSCGSAIVAGDPHLIDFRGNVFDFQAAGEFTLLKSTRDDLQVQVRLTPYGNNFSIVSAAAMRVGRSIVEVDAEKHGVLVVYVDKRRDHRSQLALRGGGRLIVQDSNGTTTVQVVWPDGSDVSISQRAGHFDLPDPLLQISLASDRKGRMAGLLGSWGASPAHEFAARNGRFIAPAQIAGRETAEGYVYPNFRVLYGRFGNSWRITQRNSLFVYARGKSTRSYLVPGFPHTPLQLSDLSAKQRALGRSVCDKEHITNAQLLNDCVLDVGETDETQFAGSDAQGQRVTGAGASLHPIELGIGDSHPVIAYDSASRETYIAWLDDSDLSVDLCAVTSAAPRCNAGHGPERLTDPDQPDLGGEPMYSHPAIVIQPDGSVVVLAEINPSSNPPDVSGGGGVVAWSSPADGAAFAAPGAGLVDGGALMASGVNDGNPPSGGAVAMGPNAIGVYGDEAINTGEPTTFTDFGLTAPSGTTAKVNPAGNFSSQVPLDGEVATMPDPGVTGSYVVVVSALGTKPAGCSGPGTAYGADVGTPPELQLTSAWPSQDLRTLDCGAYLAQVAGGDSIGMLYALTSNGAVYYRRFDPATEAFEAPTRVSNKSTSVAGALAVAQDSAGNVYAAWGNTLSNHVMISYSTRGGARWSAPVSIGLTVDSQAIAGAGGGEFEIAYLNHGNEYLVPVSYQAFG
jgi:hypothetical protein